MFTQGFIRTRFRIGLFVHRFAETHWARLYGSRSDLFFCVSLFVELDFVFGLTIFLYGTITYLVPLLSDKPSHNPANVKIIAKLRIELDTNVFEN